MSTYRTNAVVAGVLYIIGTVAGVLSIDIHLAGTWRSRLPGQGCGQSRGADPGRVLSSDNGPGSGHSYRWPCTRSSGGITDPWPSATSCSRARWRR